MQKVHLDFFDDQFDVVLHFAENSTKTNPKDQRQSSSNSVEHVEENIPQLRSRKIAEEMSLSVLEETFSSRLISEGTIRASGEIG